MIAWRRTAAALLVSNAALLTRGRRSHVGLDKICNQEKWRLKDCVSLHDWEKIESERKRKKKGIE